MFVNAPDAAMAPAPRDRVAPGNYHATTIFPEYFKVDGRWLLAGESRMDCVAVYENGTIAVREFRNLKQGDLVFTGRTENCEEGIFVYPNGFDAGGGRPRRDICLPPEKNPRDRVFQGLRQYL